MMKNERLPNIRYPALGLILQKCAKGTLRLASSIQNFANVESEILIILKNVIDPESLIFAEGKDKVRVLRIKADS